MWHVHTVSFALDPPEVQWLPLQNTSVFEGAGQPGIILGFSLN